MASDFSDVQLHKMLDELFDLGEQIQKEQFFSVKEHSQHGLMISTDIHFSV
jgi:hypothetical protein